MSLKYIFRLYFFRPNFHFVGTKPSLPKEQKCLLVTVDANAEDIPHFCLLAKQGTVKVDTICQALGKRKCTIPASGVHLLLLFYMACTCTRLNVYWPNVWDPPAQLRD